MAQNNSQQPEPAEEQFPVVPENIQDMDQTPDKMGIDMTLLLSDYNASIGYTELFIRDFRDLDNLVDGVPINRQDGAPFVGDTTMAQLVRAIPRQALKQLPVMSTIVNGSKVSVAALICTFLLKKTAFNENTFGKGLISTLQMAAEQALSHGYAPLMVASGTMYDDFGTTMRLLHPADVGLEPGISDSNESSYHFVVAHLTKSRVQRILASEVDNPNTPWNIDSLKELLKSDPTARNYAKYTSDPKRVPGTQDLGKAYEFVTRYETGQGATAVTFCPQYSTAPLRVLESKSKWGYPKIQYLVIDPAALTPFGISRVRLASPNQNFMNIYYGNTAAMLLLNSDPPMLKKGTFTGPTSLKRKAVWETTDTSASIELKTLDNGSLEQFVNMARYFASQIQSIMGGQGAVSDDSSAGDAFGKTAPGIEAGQKVMGIEANQIANILENFLRQYALVALDTLLSEQTGQDELVVDDETRVAINELCAQIIDPQTGQPTPSLVAPDNTFQMDWVPFYAGIKTWEVVVDVSISPDEMESKKRADLQDILVTLTQNASVLGPEIMTAIKQVLDLLIADIAPQISLSTGGQAAAGNGTQTSGPKVIESADLVKLLGMTTDPNVRNFIFQLIAPGAPAETTPQGPPATPEPAPALAPTPASPANPNQVIGNLHLHAAPAAPTPLESLLKALPQK